jgi:hypothetical protein
VRTGGEASGSVSLPVECFVIVAPDVRIVTNHSYERG